MCEFIDNLAYTGFQYDRGLLKTLYSNIKNQAFKSQEPPPQIIHKPRPRLSNAAMANRFVKQITDQVDCEFFRGLFQWILMILDFHGWVMVKEVYDRDGKKSKSLFCFAL
jgi:hypothetical protein